MSNNKPMRAKRTLDRVVGIFVVCAHRWGLRDAHSYVVGAYTDAAKAYRAARAHHRYRGGKYGVEVVACNGRAVEAGNAGKQVYYVESSYFELAGATRPAAHPADRRKPMDYFDSNNANSRVRGGEPGEPYSGQRCSALSQSASKIST